MFNIDNFNSSEIDVSSIRPPLSRYQELLILCYHSGQIEPSAWQEHLREDPVLASYCNPGKPRDPLH